MPEKQRLPNLSEQEVINLVRKVEKSALPKVITGERLTLLDDNVLVLPLYEEQTPGGVILPEKSQRRNFPTRGVVLATGPGKFIQATCRRAGMSVKPGDEVIYNAYQGSTIQAEHTSGAIEELRIIPESQIMAIHHQPPAGLGRPGGPGLGSAPSGS